LSVLPYSPTYLPFSIFETLEITKGKTVTFLQGGGEIRSASKCGSGNSALLFFELGVAFSPADLGFV